MFQHAKPLEPALDGSEPELLASRKIKSGRAQVESAKRAFTTRRVLFDSRVMLVSDQAPRAGDLLLARVTNLGHHQKLESPDGRRVQMYEGDTIIVTYGERYAPDQFEAVVPESLGPCELVAGGGVAGKVLNRHARARRPTAIRPVGLLADPAGRVLNLSGYALPELRLPPKRPRVIAVAGTSMNAGKTTAAAGLIHGLARAGLHVAAAKVTGTGSGNDFWSMLDAGARRVLDFTDMGHASTAGLSIEDTERVALSLIAHCAADGPDVVVVELADGLLQRETAGLLRSEGLRPAIDGVLFAAADAMGALSGCGWLQSCGHQVIAVSGLVTASPLASREAAEALCSRVVTLADLRDPVTAPTLAFGEGHSAVGLRICA